MATLEHALITCDLQHDHTVNYAVQQNHVPIIKRLRVTNAGAGDLRQVTVVCTAAPEFATRWETILSVLPAGQTVDLGVVDLQLAPAFLAGLTERISGMLTLTVTYGELTIYAAQSPIDVLAFDEWNGTQTLPEIIAAFVTPNHPEVSRLLRQAATLLGKWTDNSSLDGYSNARYTTHDGVTPSSISNNDGHALYAVSISPIRIDCRGFLLPILE